MLNEVETGRFCSACGGRIVQRTSSEYRGDPANMICGPGSRDQMTMVKVTSCSNCGLLYCNGGGVVKKRSTRKGPP